MVISISAMIVRFCQSTSLPNSSSNSIICLFVFICKFFFTLFVRTALPPELQALPHVVEQVSDMLKPSTIDGAVYNGLACISRIHGTSRPLTVGAMDGAATRGRLDIIKFLDNTRTKGCSIQAFISAAANGYVATVKWLHGRYPNMCNPEAEVVAAAEGGHVKVIKFLLLDLRVAAVERAVEAAAANGHLAVVKMLRRYVNSSRPFLTAAANCHTNVLQFMLARGYDRKWQHIIPGTSKAVQCGHPNMVEVLFMKYSELEILLG